MYYALLVFFGGGLGSLMRYGLSIFFNRALLPIGTLGSNIISCLLLGFIIGASYKIIISDPQKIFFMTGVCGGFSTFSTYSAEIVTMYNGGAAFHAFIYLMISVALGISSIALGMLLAKLFY